MQKNLKKYGWLFLLPTAVAFLFAFAAPFVLGVGLSFTRFRTVTDAAWVGLQNYVQAFTADSGFLHALWFTALFSGVSIITVNVLAFALALLLTRGLRGTNFFRGVFFMPNLIGGIVLGYIWNLLINGVLAWAGVDITYQPAYGFWGLVALTNWQLIGYMMVVYIAALQNVPDDLLEAAAIDGASRTQTLFRIKLPLVMPAVTICTFLTLTNTFKMFDQNLALTGGAPEQKTELLALNIYNTFYGRSGWQGGGSSQGGCVLYHRGVACLFATARDRTAGGPRRMRKKQKQKAPQSTLETLLLVLLSALTLVPLFLVVQNSFKSRFYISGDPFALPNKETFVALENYISGLSAGGFFAAFGRSLLITVVSVGLIVLCTSMAAWYLMRVRTALTKGMYYLFVFSMIVPFQMVMYTMTYLVGRAKLNTVLGMPFIYLGFGAGLSVFMLCGFIRGIPRELEEAATIDGCNPVQTFFLVVLPLLKPTAVTVAILNTMWIWNDYLLPYLVLGTEKKTVPVAIQIAMQGAYGSTDYGGLMAMLVLAMIPIVVFYLFCQKYIIKGVVAGAVKG